MAGTCRLKQIVDNIYEIECCDRLEPIYSSAYLIIDHDELVIFDPCNLLSNQMYISSIASLIPIHKISHIVFQFQDAYIATTLMLFKENGFIGKVISHWSITYQLKKCNVQFPCYMLYEQELKIILRSYRELVFLPNFQNPSLGSFVTYDPITKTLFTGSLFSNDSFVSLIESLSNVKINRILSGYESYNKFVNSCNYVTFNFNQNAMSL